MTPEDIAKAREIIAAATPGPWQTSPSGYDHAPYIMTKDMGILARHTNYGKMREDAAFVIAARTGWPEALDEVERLATHVAAVDHYYQDEITKLRAENTKLVNDGLTLSEAFVAQSRVCEKLLAVKDAAEITEKACDDGNFDDDEHLSLLFKALKAWKGE